MRSVALYEMLYGIVSLVLGLLGWVIAGSVVSFVAGGIAGIILVLGGLQMQKGSIPALYVCLVVTIALLIRFGMVLVREFAWYPSAIMAILSAISLVLLVLLLVQPAERKRLY